ncbi:hypothetical protein M130_4149 [Bacteroides fragilis str. S6R6]|nr:hypothetical protein M130_4149 [Bacteroides fragilis str. S6R6]
MYYNPQILFALLAKKSQFPPFISISLKNAISYKINFYIRTDGLKFTRY